MKYSSKDFAVVLGRGIEFRAGMALAVLGYCLPLPFHPSFQSFRIVNIIMTALMMTMMMTTTMTVMLTMMVCKMRMTTE